MEVSKTKRKRILYNTVSAFGYQVIVIALGLIVPRLYLINFGSEVNGVVQVVKQVFAYLWVLEAGVGQATQQALYYPVARDDQKNINSIMAATDRYYRKTGVVYAAFVIAFAVVYPFFAESSLSRFTVFYIVILNGIPSLCSYWFIGKYRILLTVEGKSYIFNTLETLVQCAVNFGRILLIILTKNVLLVQSVYCIGTILQVICISIYVKKHYKWLNLKVTPDFKAISQKSSVLVHQISAAVFNNTDAILLSIFCNFKVVSVYTTYNLFFSYIEKFINSLTSGVTFSLGQLYHVEKKQFKRVYDAYETIYLTLVFCVFTMAGLFLMPVIRIYTDGVEDISYVDYKLLFLFIIVQLLAQIKMPCTQVIQIAGDFEKTQHMAVIEMLLNLGITIIAIPALGIYGGLLGTIIALVYRCIAVFIYTSHLLLDRSVWNILKKCGMNIVLAAGCILFFSINSMEYESYISIIKYAIPYGLLVVVLFILMNLIFERKACRLIYDYIRKRVND